MRQAESATVRRRRSRSAETAGAVRRRRRLVLDAALAVVGVGVAVWRLAPTVSAVGVGSLRGVPAHALLLPVAVGLGLGSLLAYGEMTRLVLRRAKEPSGFALVQSVNLVANAVTNTVPTAGGAAGGAFAIGALQRRGVSTGAAVSAVVLPALVAGITLITLTPFGLAVGGLLSVPVGSVLAAAVLGLIGLVWWLSRRPRQVRRVLARGLAVLRRLPVLRARPWAVEDPRRVAGRISAEMSRIPLRHNDWAALAGIAFGSWLLDYLTLITCLAATGQPVVWSATALGYLAVQASIAVQLTPGGAGPAETGLLAALLAGGVPAGPAAVTVVLYRGISWVGLPVVGWVTFAVGVRRRSRAAPPGG